MKKCVIYLLFLLIGSCHLQAAPMQNPSTPNPFPSLPNEGQDSIQVVVFSDIVVYPPHQFTNSKGEQQYLKLIRDVKKTLPYAKFIYQALIETYEYMETLPDEKSKETHIKLIEKELFAEYKPIMRKMTLSQGKLLIKLIDRECNQTSYDLLKAFLGPFRAGFWNLFAGMFGANLKTNYNPMGKDAMIEQVVLLIECGAL